jgi:hypothetical protein
LWGAPDADLDVEAFATRLWGDLYFHAEKRTFSKKAVNSKAQRSFVQFVLEPMYKLFAQVWPAESGRARFHRHPPLPPSLPLCNLTRSRACTGGG